MRTGFPLARLLAARSERDSDQMNFSSARPPAGHRHAGCDWECTHLGALFRSTALDEADFRLFRKGEPRMISTNAVENFWSLFKRGLLGPSHKVSVNHLRRYLDAYSFRFNNREAEDLFALVMLNLVIVSGIKHVE